jgi:hypothetical protein
MSILNKNYADEIDDRVNASFCHIVDVEISLGMPVIHRATLPDHIVEKITSLFPPFQFVDIGSNIVRPSFMKLDPDDQSRYLIERTILEGLNDPEILALSGAVRITRMDAFCHIENNKMALQFMADARGWLKSITLSLDCTWLTGQEYIEHLEEVAYRRRLTNNTPSFF